MKLAGPWIGEFGWELFCWQGYLRYIAAQGEDVVVICRPGHEFLYEDFAKDILNYRPKSKHTDMWMCKGDDIDKHWPSGPDIIPYHAYRSFWWNREPIKTEQEFVSYKNLDAISLGIDVLLLVRQTSKCGTDYRDWPYDHAKVFAQALTTAGYAVATIGTSNGAVTVPGALDLRNEPLSNLTDIMSTVKLIVGPQSGPIHLASLCELPQLCWQPQQDDQRIEKFWNPFNVNTATFPSPDPNCRKNKELWVPPMGSLLDKTYALLDMMK